MNEPALNETPGPRRLDDDPALDDPIRRVLRLAGPRAAVPEEAVALARLAARAEWQRQVRAHARRGRLRRAAVWLAAAGVTVAAGLTVRELTSRFAAGPVGVVETVAGTPDVRLGETIRAGRLVESGAGRLAVRLAGGASVRLDAETRVRWLASGRLELERGAVYVDSGGDPTSAVAVLTGLGTVTDVGTQFEVRLAADGLRVRVREGRVLVDRDGRAAEGRPGDELRLAADGTLARGRAAAYGPDWDWVLATAPPFAADGRSLEAFLEWLCHEGGWTLRFADPALAAQAPKVTLSGDMAGLRPLEAAELFLRGSDLDFEIDDGAFVVLGKGAGP